MNNFVELWVYFSATPLFGLTVALAVYVLGNAVCVRLAKVPWANAVYVRLAKVPWAIPVLLTVLTLPIALSVVWVFGFRISDFYRYGGVQPNLFFGDGARFEAVLPQPDDRVHCNRRTACPTPEKQYR